MTGGRRRIWEFRRKWETAHLTRFKQSVTSWLRSQTRRRPFIRCVPPPGGGSSISSSFYQFFLKHQLFKRCTAHSAVCNYSDGCRSVFAYSGRGEKAARWGSLAAEVCSGGVLWRWRRAAERYLIIAPDRLLLSFTYERPLYRGLADQMNSRGAPGSPVGPKLWRRCGRCGAAEGRDDLN